MHPAGDRSHIVVLHFKTIGLYRKYAAPLEAEFEALAPVVRVVTLVGRQLELARCNVAVDVAFDPAKRRATLNVLWRRTPRRRFLRGHDDDDNEAHAAHADDIRVPLDTWAAIRALVVRRMSDRVFEQYVDAQYGGNAGWTSPPFGAAAAWHAEALELLARAYTAKEVCATCFQWATMRDDVDRLHRRLWREVEPKLRRAGGAAAASALPHADANAPDDGAEERLQALAASRLRECSELASALDAAVPVPSVDTAAAHLGAPPHTALMYFERDMEERAERVAWEREVQRAQACFGRVFQDITCGRGAARGASRRARAVWNARTDRTLLVY